MPFATGGNARIRTNIAAQNAYNNIEIANKSIASSQLKLSTGKRINSAGDDVAGYITSKSIIARNGAMKIALNAVGDATNVANIVMDAMSNIDDLVTKIKDSTATAASGAMGTDEKVALAKAAYRLVEQIQTVVDTTVFSGQQLLTGNFSAEFIVGTNAAHDLKSLTIDMTSSNRDFNVESNNFNLNSLSITDFAGVSGLNMNDFNSISSTDLGIFATTAINTTLVSIANALNNINKAASYMGGVVIRLSSQEDLLKSEIVNNQAAISRIEDVDVAQEQLELIKNQFLQQASLVSLSQANQNPQSFLQLLNG